jgi:antitoxin YefM
MTQPAMISGFRQKTTVGDGGRIEIVAPNLSPGVAVEVIVFVEPAGDTTEYLLSTTANRQHLLKAMEDLHDRDLYTFVDLDEL